MQFESLVEMENWRRKSSSFIYIYDDDYSENNIRFTGYPGDSDKPLYQRPEDQKKTGVSGKKAFAILNDPINIDLVVSLKVECRHNYIKDVQCPGNIGHQEALSNWPRNIGHQEALFNVLVPK